MSNDVFRQKFTRIKGLSSIRRLPRLGKIRLGIKKVTAKGKEYPSETDYFVCPAEVCRVCGQKPKELKISFPINDPEVIFPQCYKWYGASKGLKCRGNGVEALRLNEETGEMEERTCPCELLENGKCKQRASLVFNLLDVGIGGVYQIDLSSYHSIVDINSGIDYARALLNDQIAFVPFKLKRVPKETHNDGKKQIHYTLQLELNITARELKKRMEGTMKVFQAEKMQYEIEAPKEDVNPVYDSKEDGAVIVKEDELVTEEVEKEAEVEQTTNNNDPASQAQVNLIVKNVIASHLLKKAELEKINKLIENGLTKNKASDIISWWIGDKQNNVIGERAKREAKEKEAKDTKEPKPGSSIDNAIPYKGKDDGLEINDPNAPEIDAKEKPKKAHKVSKGSDFISDEDLGGVVEVAPGVKVAELDTF